MHAAAAGWLAGPFNRAVPRSRRLTKKKRRKEKKSQRMDEKEREDRGKEAPGIGLHRVTLWRMEPRGVAYLHTYIYIQRTADFGRVAPLSLSLSPRSAKEKLYLSLSFQNSQGNEP